MHDDTATFIGTSTTPESGTERGSPPCFQTSALSPVMNSSMPHANTCHRCWGSLMGSTLHAARSRPTRPGPRAMYSAPQHPLPLQLRDLHTLATMRWPRPVSNGSLRPVSVSPDLDSHLITIPTDVLCRTTHVTCMTTSLCGGGGPVSCVWLPGGGVQVVYPLGMSSHPHGIAIVLLRIRLSQSRLI